MTGPSRQAAAETQMRFDFPRPPAFSREQFVVSDRNRAAARAIDAWPAWLGGCLALIGPPGSGKTHLASAWAKRTGAHVIDGDNADLAAIPSGAVLYEDADRRTGDALLFHLMNRAGVEGSLLLTARALPRSWSVSLPDLRSRLNLLPFAEIEEPDDAILEGVLMHAFRRRDIRPDPELLAYLLTRIERAAPAAQAIVARLDAAADALGRGVNRALASHILGDDDKAGDPPD